MPTPFASLYATRAILAANRPQREGDQPARPAEMERHASLRACYDPRHAFRTVSGVLVLRAVDDEGRFCWLVRDEGGFDTLAYVANPYEAPGRTGGGSREHAASAAAMRELGTALRRGDVRMTLTSEDFRGCGPVLRALGRRGMPGWLAALLLPAAPQLGTAIWAAHRRTLTTRQHRLAAIRGVGSPGAAA